MFLHNLNASPITSQYLYITYFCYRPSVPIVLITTDMLSRAGCKTFPVLSIINTHLQLCSSRTTVEHQICEIWQHGSYGPWRSILIFTKKENHQIQNSKSCCKAEVEFQVHLETQTFRNLGML